MPALSAPTIYQGSSLSVGASVTTSQNSQQARDEAHVLSKDSITLRPSIEDLQIYYLTRCSSPPRTLRGTGMPVLAALSDTQHDNDTNSCRTQANMVQDNLLTRACKCLLKEQTQRPINECSTQALMPVLSAPTIYQGSSLSVGASVTTNQTSQEARDEAHVRPKIASLLGHRSKTFRSTI